MVSVLANRSGCPGFDPLPSQKFIREKIIPVAEVNQRCWLEESEYELENVDQTHLVLASNKARTRKKVK